MFAQNDTANDRCHILPLIVKPKKVEGLFSVEERCVWEA